MVYTVPFYRNQQNGSTLSNATPENTTYDNKQIEKIISLAVAFLTSLMKNEYHRYVDLVESRSEPSFKCHLESHAKTCGIKPHELIDAIKLMVDADNVLRHPDENQEQRAMYARPK